MSPKNPDWLPEVRDFCRRSSIAISGWGADTIIVEAKTPEQSAQASSLLRQFGFEPMPNEDDESAGLLLLSRDPAATRARQTTRDAINVSRRPLNERVAPAFEALLFIWLLWYSVTQPPAASLRFAAYAGIALVVAVWDFSRTSGWRLQTSPEELRVRRYFLWSRIPWSQVRGLETAPARSRGANRELVNLSLASNATFRLGVFGYKFAHALRDRLRSELAQRRPNSHQA